MENSKSDNNDLIEKEIQSFSKNSIKEFLQKHHSGEMMYKTGKPNSNDNINTLIELINKNGLTKLNSEQLETWIKNPTY